MIIELDGKLWTPVPEATVTADEFIAARSVIGEIHQSVWWNPWVTEDRAAEYEAAWDTCGQWTRGEPDLFRKTPAEYAAELKQKMAEAEAQAAAQRDQVERDRTERAARYDPERAQARLALLEEQDMLADKARERDEIISPKVFQAMDDWQRDGYLAGLEAEITAGQRAVDELAAVAGDPETVCDERGWLPAERREVSLTLFRVWREAEVSELRARVSAQQAELKSMRGRAGRARAARGAADGYGAAGVPGSRAADAGR